jgi:hypothetical protein
MINRCILGKDNNGAETCKPQPIHSKIPKPAKGRNGRIIWVRASWTALRIDRIQRAVRSGPPVFVGTNLLFDKFIGNKLVVRGCDVNRRVHAGYSVGYWPLFGYEYHHPPLKCYGSTPDCRSGSLGSTPSGGDQRGWI